MGGRNAKKRLLNILCTSLDIWAGIWCESVEWERVANGLVMGCARRDGNVEPDMRTLGCFHTGTCKGGSRSGIENCVASQRCKKWEIREIYLCYFLAGANFWAILAILGHFWAILGHFWAIFWC